MAAGYNSQDVLRQSLIKAGELGDGTSPYQEQAMGFLNQAHIDIVSGSSVFNLEVGDPWPWARSRVPGSLILKAPYETGSVALTNGVATGTFSVAPPVGDGSYKDRFIKLDSGPDYYRISVHTAGGTSFTLDSVFVGDTTAGSPFKAIKLIYDLGNTILRLVEPFRVDHTHGLGAENDGLIYGISVSDLRRNYPIIQLVSTIPDKFALIYESESEYLIQFSSYVIEDTKVEFDYIPYPDPLIDSVSSIPLIPFKHRKALEFATASLLCMDKQDTAKAQVMLQAAQAEIKSMQKASSRQVQQTSKYRGQLIPRLEQLSRFNYRYRGVR